MASSPETRTMRHPDVREKRRALLALPHVAPLAFYTSSLRVHGDVPDFDPLDGGINAEVLFLFEKPGPMASGSGFISRDSSVTSGSDARGATDPAELRFGMLTVATRIAHPTAQPATPVALRRFPWGLPAARCGRSPGWAGAGRGQ